MLTEKVDTKKRGPKESDPVTTLESSMDYGEPSDFVNPYRAHSATPQDNSSDSKLPSGYLLGQSIDTNSLRTGSQRTEHKEEDGESHPKNEQEFEVFQQHRETLYQREIYALSDEKAKTKKEKEFEKFHKKSNKFQTKLTEKGKWDTENFYTKRNRKFKDYGATIEDKKEEVRNNISVNVSAIGYSLADEIVSLTDAVIIADTNSEAAINALAETKISLNQTKASKVRASSAVSKDEEEQILNEYDDIFSKYEELVSSLEANISGIAADRSSFNSMILELDGQVETLIALGDRAEKEDDVLTLISLHDVELKNLRASIDVSIAKSQGTIAETKPITDQAAETIEHLEKRTFTAEDKAMRSTIRYNKPLTDAQKVYFNWEEVIKAFRALETHKNVTETYLQQWARKQLRLGWTFSQPVPDLHSFRSEEGDPHVYEVTGEEVPTLYVYYYEGNMDKVRNELVEVQKFDGFWVYVNSITGAKSVLQQRNSLSKYYSYHPISPADIQLVFNLLDLKGEKYVGNTATISEDSPIFREAVERTQELLFGSPPSKGYGLLTPETKAAVVKELKKLQIAKEREFMKMSATKKFKDAGNKTGIASDPEGFSDRTGKWEKGGVNLRSSPFTPDDAKGTSYEDDVSENFIKHLEFGARMTILRETIIVNGEDPGWYSVMTEDGEQGYVVKHLVETNLPAPDVKYHLIKEGDTLLEIARKYYSSYSKDQVGNPESNPEFRNYVLELARYNEKYRGKDAGAVFKEGYDPMDKYSWEHTTVRIGLRMWIPSAAQMYYLVESRSEDQKFDNTHWLVDAGQWILDHSLNTEMINAYLSWWETIPQEEREKNTLVYYKQQLELYKKLQTDWSWLDKYVVPVIPWVPIGGVAFGISLIYDLYISFNIGYFDQLSKSDPKSVILNVERTLRNLTKIDFYIGIVNGFFKGIYIWGKDLMETFQSIVDLVDVLSDPETYENIKDFFGDAADYVIQNKDKIAESLKDLSFLDVITGLASGARSMLISAGENMGRSVAKGIAKFAGKSPYDQGFSVGKIIGYIVPEVLLAIFSAGIGTAVKAGLKSLQLVIKPILTGIKVTVAMVKQAASAAKSIVKLITHVLTKLKKGASKFWEKLKELFEGFQDFLRKKYDDVGKKNSNFNGSTNQKNVKVFSKIEFDEYIKNVRTRNASGNVNADFRKYQEKVAGMKEYELTEGNSKIWADGVDRASGTALEAKYIKDPNLSPFVEDSKIPEFIRKKIKNEVRGEFQRYADIINSTGTPIVGLEIITNNAQAKFFFESLLAEFKIPGSITIKY